MLRRPLAALSALALAAVVAGCGLFDSDEDTTILPPPPEVDISYGPAGICAPDDATCSGSQTLDIYRSDEPGPNPVLLWIHGGAFVLGDKSRVSADLQPVLDAGWDVVSISYRLSLPDGINAFPTALQDAKLAVRWVRANAEAQDWDPDAIAAIGHSAGGNLVGLLATTAGDPELEPAAPAGFEQLDGVDSSILAGIALAPVSDLPLFAAVDEETMKVVVQYLDCGQDCDAAFAAGSVQTHVDADSAPLIQVHGVEDALADPTQGELVQQAYVDAGIEDRFELIVVDDGPEDYRGHNIEVARFVDRFIDFLNDQRS